MEGTIITAILAVWTAVSQWFVTTIPSLSVIFYAEGALTFFGSLAVGGIAVGVILLLFMIATKFMKFKG